MVAIFQRAAERERFLVVAPDSRIAPNGQASWEVGDRAGEVTEDFMHVRQCAEELMAMRGVLVDTSRVLIVGHSGGGSSAPYMATNDEMYTAFAVLHGGVFPGGLGERNVRGWFSTGDADLIRPRPKVERAAEEMRLKGFNKVEYRTFPGGHEVGTEEIEALMRWWLHP
jgi:poly(3-hydroxybutyrate) depolymerase